MGKISSSMTVWCRWRDEVSRQGIAKHRQRGGGRRAGLRRGRGKTVSPKAQKCPLYIGGGEGGATPRIPTLGGVAAPPDGRCGGQGRGRGWRTPRWALGPPAPRVPPLSPPAPWAACGRRTSPLWDGFPPSFGPCYLLGLVAPPGGPPGPLPVVPVVQLHYR